MPVEWCCEIWVDSYAKTAPWSQSVQVFNIICHIWLPAVGTRKDELSSVSPWISSRCVTSLSLAWPSLLGLPLFWKSLHLYVFFHNPYLCFPLATLTFSRVSSGTNLAAWFLERPNSRTQQWECVWVCVCDVCFVCVCLRGGERGKVLVTQI